MINSSENTALNFKSEKGYTLLELITVCMIIGILATMSVTLVSRARVNARETAAVVTLNSLAGAWESYWSRNGVYPHWGEGQRFSDPNQLFQTLIDEGYLPHAYRNVVYSEDSQIFTRITDDYALEIYEFDSKGGTRGPGDYYWLLFHPMGFQRTQGYLGIGTNSAGGKITVRPRLGERRGDIDSFSIYGMQRRSR
jgi:prepilin-type N-terminal cleavage/methylation domain-containing protein